MQKLFERARGFVYRSARPLDYALWRYHFEGGSSDDVLRTLAAYQNADGGFGHGTEADVLNPDSNPISTWSATTVLRSIDCFDPEHPIIAGILRYLASEEHFDGHCWQQTIPTNNIHPHAPWWTHAETDTASGRNYNPSAALAGFLVRSAPYGTCARRLGIRIAREAFDYFMTYEAETEMHLLPCYLTLCLDVRQAMPDLFDTNAMLDRLRSAITECVQQDAERWEGNYCARPSDFLNFDPSLRNCFPELANRECGFIATTQEPTGAWPVTWRWDAYPDDFAVSACFWKSHIAIKNILYLKNMSAL